MRAKSRWRQHWRYYRSPRKSRYFETMVRWSEAKDYADEVTRKSIMEGLDVKLKSLDSPVSKWETHRRVKGKGRGLMPRKPGGYLGDPELRE